MSYYQGDWYRGDFYRGDPGFFSGLFNIAKKAVGFIPGVGPALSTGLSMIPSGGGHVPVAGSQSKVTALTSLGSKALAAVKGHPILSAAGAAGAIGAGSMMLHPGAGAMTANGRAKGYHMSKPRKGVAPHMVRNRRMNVCNPRALRRSLRRTHGFAKLAMKTIHIVHPKKKGRFGGFKKRVRRG